MTTIGPASSQLPAARTGLAGAAAQAAADPLRPTAADGWSPDRIIAVNSRHEGGFLGSALNFTLGGVDEQPGQRLSVAQVDALAPFYATEFGLDEGFVRAELAKVYVYVGGPSVGGQAMTIGHHVFVDSEQSLERILTPPGRRWLAHELVHTMQFLSYQGASPQRFLADYFTGMVVGQDPRQPGTGSGPSVWGAIFTGLRTAGRPEAEIGKGATTLRDQFASTLLPASVVSVPLAMIGGGALAATRSTTGRRLFGTGNALKVSIGGIAAPALAGAVIGSYREQLGDGWTKALGTVAGGALAGATLWRSGAFNVGGATAATELGKTLGRTGAIGLAVGGTIAGAAIGLLSATASANTMRGWSSSADVLHSLHNQPAGEAPKELGLQDAIHDSHWMEIDAEAIARRYAREWEAPRRGTPPVEGRTPTGPTGLGDKIETDLGARLDWGLRVPLIVGIPAAVGIGAGMLATRAGVTMATSTFVKGEPLGKALSEALLMLGDKGRGVTNSLGVGAAVTVAPLVLGGLVGPLAYNVTGSESAARVTGAGVGAVAAGAWLTFLLKGGGASAAITSTKVGVGMAVAGALGFLASGVATEALRPQQREYDASGRTRAAATAG